jgi:Cu2+-exporting ATPase
MSELELIGSVLKDATRHAWDKTILANSTARSQTEAKPGLRVSQSTPKPYSQDTSSAGHEQGTAKSALAQANLAQEDKQLNQEVALSAVALGLSAAGVVVAHPLALLSLPILIKLGMPYWRDGYQSLVKERKINRPTFDAVALSVFLAAGLYSFTAFWLGAVGLSKKLVLRTRSQSERALADAFGEQPRKVWVVFPDGREIEISFADLKPGDQVIVRGGEHIPADGYITKGIAAIDRRMLTGEAQPVESGVGDQVFASTLVVSGQIMFQVEKSGQETTAAQIAEILRNTADYQSSVEQWSRRFGDQVALPQLALTTAALPVAGLQGAMAVLVSDVAWDARVTGPLSVLNFLNLATKHGILIKDGHALELLSTVNTVVFDKTGTLTLEQPELGKIYVRDGLDENQLLMYAASAEARQTHPIARAILQAAQARQLDLSASQDARYEVGFGILVHLADKRVHVGSARYMDMENIDIPTDWRAEQAVGQAQGYSYVYVAVDRRLSGMIELCPAIRPEVKQLVQQLQARNLSLYILSGDHEQVTASLAKHLGIENYFAEVLPTGKADIIERLQDNGASVCFVGDGINDAIALKKAHVSVSLHGASAVASDAASMVLMDGNLEKLGRLFEIADGLRTNLRGDLLASFVPGAVAIGSVFLFHIGVIPSMLIGIGGFTTGMINSMTPRLPASEKEKE